MSPGSADVVIRYVSVEEPENNTDGDDLLVFELREDNEEQLLAWHDDALALEIKHCDKLEGIPLISSLSPTR